MLLVSTTGETLAPPHRGLLLPSPSFPHYRWRVRPSEARVVSVRFLLLPTWTRGGAGRPSMAGSQAPRWSLAAGTSGSSCDDVAGRWWCGAASLQRRCLDGGEDGVRLQTGTTASRGVLFLLQYVDLEASSARPATRWRRGDAGAARQRGGGSQAPLTQIWALRAPSRSWWVGMFTPTSPVTLMRWCGQSRRATTMVVYVQRRGLYGSNMGPAGLVGPSVSLLPRPVGTR
jgi:hypothetical protein